MQPRYRLRVFACRSDVSRMDSPLCYGNGFAIERLARCSDDVCLVGGQSLAAGRVILIAGQKDVEAMAAALEASGHFAFCVAWRARRDADIEDEVWEAELAHLKAEIFSRKSTCWFIDHGL